MQCPISAEEKNISNKSGKKKKVLDALHSLIQLARRAVFFNCVDVQVLRPFCKFSFALSICYVESMLVGMSSLFS